MLSSTGFIVLCFTLHTLIELLYEVQGAGYGSLV